MRSEGKAGRFVIPAATRERLFYVQGVGFVIAGRIALGNAIVTRAGSALT